MPVSFKVYWGMHHSTLTISIIITIIYWSVIYNGEFAIYNSLE